MARIIYNPKKHDKIYLRDSRLNKEFHSKYGIVYEEELKKTGKIETHNGTELSIFDASFTDDFTNLKRRAQLITIKDAAAILAETGINSNSVIYDSGSGSGGISCFLAKFAKKVFSFDIREEHLDVAKKNAEELNLNNLKYAIADVYNPDDFKKSEIADVFTLDVPEPEKAIATINKVLKIGGYAVAYTPQLTQAKAFVNSLEDEDNFEVLYTKEIQHRHWDVFGRKAKPINLEIGHTGFLVFARKLF